MTIVARTIASLLLCAAALPALANPQQGIEQGRGASPTEAELVKWKKDVLDRYKHVAYLDAHERPMSETDFLRAVRGGRNAFSMTAAQRNMEHVTVRLLAPDAAAQAPARPAQ
jgi:hypothetical protein